MKITIDKHYSLKEINNSLQRQFKNYKFHYSPSDIEVVLPDGVPIIIVVKGKEIILRKRAEFADLIPILGWIAMAGRSNLLNNVYAKEILDFIKNDVSLTEAGTDNINEFPSICPHCKSPNNKKLKICEWCGGKML
jgi:hypothetical protein